MFVSGWKSVLRIVSVCEENPDTKKKKNQQQQQQKKQKQKNKQKTKKQRKKNKPSDVILRKQTIQY